MTEIKRLARGDSAVESLRSQAVVGEEALVTMTNDYSPVGGLRIDFFCETIRLSATERCLERRDLWRFCRRIFSIAWVLALALPSRIISSCSQSSRRARKRFISRERSIWHLIQTPVGKCFRKTQFDVLLIFCPPAPEPLTNFSNNSTSLIPSAFIRSSSALVFSVVIRFCIDFRRVSSPQSFAFFPFVWIRLK